ncbi:ComEC/Rec2 family competence protein [Gryllotalpicola reticulitermitis]|uniref:ComEC/Rec2 family competence protein n=1 Tax=Gryllotalpicola reticulitermitis TaxID=1184153 RepID=A0ABV8QA67_9MICO
MAVWLTAGLLVACPGWGWACAGAAAAVAAITAAVSAPGRRREARPTSRRQGAAGTVIVIAAAIGLAGAATAAAGAMRHPAALDSAASGHRVALDATVTSTARESGAAAFGDRRITFRVTALRVDIGTGRIVGRMPALISTTQDRGAPHIGERIRVTGALTASEPADNIAFAVFSARWQHVAAPPAWLGWADGLRGGFAEASVQLPGDGGALLPGLSIGDESRVSAELDADMKASSLSHLTAVSGSNCAVIVAGLIGLGASVGLSRRWRVAMSLIGLAGFVVLVTPGASVLRAAVMASIVVFGLTLGRPGRALPALALAVIVLVVQNPWLARDYGFALSVLATAALLLLARPLAHRLERWLPRWLAIGLAVPLAAQLACQPVLVLLNPTLPLYGVVANVLAEPAAPIATVIGLIGCLLLPLCPPLATPLLWLAWLPSAWIASIAHTSVALPASAVPWPAGVAGFALAVVLTGLVVVLVARPRTARSRLVRRVCASAAAVTLVVAAAGQLGVGVARRASMPRDWVVGMCDVGQGDASLNCVLAEINTSPIRKRWSPGARPSR